MRFSVIIVHRNGVDMLMRALDSLASALDADRDEVLLVDNGSQDDTLDQLRRRHPAIRVIANGCNAGFARACNQGIRQARGEFVLLLNNDAFIDPGTLRQLEQVLREWPRAGIVAAQLVGPDGRPQRSHGRVPTPASEMGLARLKPVVTRADGVNEVETVVGACMAVRRAAIEQAGSLDEDFFFYFEETEWCVRMRRHGWQVLFDPRIRIVHLKGASTRAVRSEAQVEMLRSRLIFYRKVYSQPVAMGLTLWRIARLCVNALAHGFAVLLTLGRFAKLRAKFMIYLKLLAWLAAGRPDSWGLPDKCPRLG